MMNRVATDTMATSLIVPLAYTTVLIGSLLIFSRIYRRRRAAEQTAEEPWFPEHASRNIYVSLLQAQEPVPDSMLKSALLVRATEDVRRIWRLRDDKAALQVLINKGSIGDDTLARFAVAEKELEAEIVEVVGEANTFREGWGQLIFATASEMAHSEKQRNIVRNIGKVKERTDKDLAKRGIVIGNAVNGVPQPPPAIAAAIAAQMAAMKQAQVAPPTETSLEKPIETPVTTATPTKPSTAPSSGTASPIKPGSGANTPSKSTPGKKKKGKK